MIYPRKIWRNIKRFIYHHQIEIAAIVFLSLVASIVGWFMHLHL